MKGLPKSIIKKYGVSKKAWAVFRGRKHKKRASHSIKLKTGNKMARKRKYYKKHRSSRKSTSMFGVNTAKALSAVLYGAVRSKTSTMLSPYTSKLPLGEISDEAGMLIATTLAKKFLFKKSGTLRDAMTAGQMIELARIGDYVANVGVSGILNPSSTSSSNGYVFA